MKRYRTNIYKVRYLSNNRKTNLMRKCDCGKKLSERNRTGMCIYCKRKSDCSVRQMMKQINKTKALKGVKY